jgi:hypothetical protein
VLRPDQISPFYAAGGRAAEVTAEGSAEGFLMLISYGDGCQVDLEALPLEEPRGGIQTQCFDVLADPQAQNDPEPRGDVVVPDPATMFDRVDIEARFENMGVYEFENC